MEIKDYVQFGLHITGFIIIIVSWFVLKKLDRKNDKFKTLLPYKLEIYKDFFYKIAFRIEKENIIKLDKKMVQDLQNIRIKFHFYGDINDIKKIDELVESYTKQDMKSFTNSLIELRTICKIKLRKELDIK